MRTEVDDLDALLMETGSHDVFGVSTGGLIALQAALILLAIRKLALYEPALIVHGSTSTTFLARYDRETAQPGAVTMRKLAPTLRNDFASLHWRRKRCAASSPGCSTRAGHLRDSWRAPCVALALLALRAAYFPK
jgi:pimeloyl-ACP methyl ester carboxylesterase